MDKIEDDEPIDLTFDQQLGIWKRQQDQDRITAGLALGLGAIPATGVMARLWQGTQGYQVGNLTTQQQPGNPFDPNALFNAIKQLIDAEIQLFIQGFITAAQLAAYIAGLGFATLLDIDRKIATALANLPSIVALGIQDVDNEINKLVPQLLPNLSPYALKQDVQNIDSAIRSDTNVAVNWINNNILSPLQGVNIFGLKPFSWIPLIPTVPTSSQPKSSSTDYGGPRGH